MTTPAEAITAPPPPEGEARHHAHTFWGTCRRLIDAYPARPTDLGHADELRSLRDELTGQATALVGRLAPGPEWRADVSLGSARWAARPWVAFLDPRQATSTRHGVFAVVDLLWQRTRAVRLGLVVAVGEEHAARGANVMADLVASGELDHLLARGFTRVEPARIATLDESHEGRLARLLSGGLLLQKTISLTEPHPASQSLDEDLRALLTAYGRWVDAHGHDPLPADPTRPIHDLVEAVDALAGAATRRQLLFSKELLGSLLVSLKTSPVVVLQGPPGSGKTSLVRLLADVGVRVSPRTELDLSALREAITAAAADPRRQHVLLLEEPPRRASERTLLTWLGELEAGGTTPNLAVAWTRSSSRRPLCARLLDRVNVLTLPPPAPVELGTERQPSGAPPGVLESDLLRSVPGGWRAVLHEHDGPVSAALVHLKALVRDTQGVLALRSSPVQLSWRAADGVFEYGLLAVASDLTTRGLGRIGDQGLRQRLVPALLAHGPGRLDLTLVDDLIALWSRTGGDGPESASAALRAARGVDPVTSA